MCGPVAIGAMLAISAAVAIGQQVMAHNAQKEAAQDAINYQVAQREQAKQVAENQYAAYRHAADRLNLRDNQEREKAAQEAFNAKLQTMRTRERGRAAASNISGISVDALLGDISASGARQQNTITANLNNSLEQSAAERRGLFAPVQSAFLQANAPMRKVRGPSPLALGLGIAGTVAQTGVKAYTSGAFGTGGMGGGVTSSQAQAIGSVPMAAA